MDDEAAIKPGDGVADGVSPTADTTEFSPPRIEADTGIALEGDYPANHRLRAERLSRDGKASDPGGLISDELIADTAERLSREDTPSRRTARKDR